MFHVKETGLGTKNDKLSPIIQEGMCWNVRYGMFCGDSVWKAEARKQPATLKLIGELTRTRIQPKINNKDSE